MLYQVIQVGKFFASFLFTTKTKTTMTPHELMWQKGNLLYALIFVPSFFFDTQRADMSFFSLKNPTVCSALYILYSIRKICLQLAMTNWIN